MSVAIRAITRLQDADDLNVTLGVGVDEYALSWDNDTAKFVLRAPFDGTPYALLAGRAGGQVLYGGTAANEALTLEPTSHATKTTASVLLAPSGGNVGVGVAIANTKLDVAGIVSSGATGGSGEFRSYQDSFAGNNYVSLRTDTSAQKSGLYRNGTPAFFAFYDTGSGNVALSANFSGASIAFQIGGVEKARVSNEGRLGIGTTAPATILHVTSTTATTNALRNVLTLGANVTSTGVGAAGLGAAVLFTMETTTTADTSAASVQAIIYEATHATRKFDLVGNAYDTAIREGWRVRGNGSAPAIGFLGATPQARIAHVADPAGGATVDAEARSAINSILATLENFGFHATS